MHHKVIHVKGGKLVMMKRRLISGTGLIGNFIAKAQSGIKFNGHGLLISSNVLNAPVNLFKKATKDTVTLTKYPKYTGGSLLNNIKVPIGNVSRKLNSNIRFK